MQFSRRKCDVQAICAGSILCGTPFVRHAVVKSVGTPRRMPNHSSSGGVFLKTSVNTHDVVFFFARRYVRAFFDLSVPPVSVFWRRRLDSAVESTRRGPFSSICFPRTYLCAAALGPEIKAISAESMTSDPSFPGISDWSFRPFNTIILLPIRVQPSGALRNVCLGSTRIRCIVGYYY